MQEKLIVVDLLIILLVEKQDVRIPLEILMYS